MGNSFRQTVSGIFSDERMDTSVLLESHLSSSKDRINSLEEDYILVAQDTTYYNYTGHKAMANLGKIQGNVLGIAQHNSLIISEKGTPLGVLSQEYWSRESPHAYDGVESQKWFRSLEKVNGELGGLNKGVVMLQDREADIYSFFEAPRCPNVDLIVRLCQLRNMEIDSSGAICKLTQLSEKLPIIGTKQVTIIREGQSITLELALKHAKVNIIQDLKIKHYKTTQGLGIVIAEEVNAFDSKGESIFKEQEKVLWYLLTSLPIDTQEQVERVVNFYALRWRIERFHFTLKSGALNVERLQFDDLKTMTNALTFYSIVAWQILAITYLLREQKDQDASTCFEDKELKVLELITNKKIKTVKEATLALCKSVNFTPSKKNPMPGIKILAQALERFYYIKLGFDAKPK
jgi:hypothetical protein